MAHRAVCGRDLKLLENVDVSGAGHALDAMRYGLHHIKWTKEIKVQWTDGKSAKRSFLPNSALALKQGRQGQHRSQVLALLTLVDLDVVVQCDILWPRLRATRFPCTNTWPVVAQF